MSGRTPSIEQRLEFYQRHYQVRFKYESFATHERTLLGDKNGGCRFCGRGDAGSFRSRSHALPEFLGNKLLFLDDECDKCNGEFGLYEAHLAKYLGLDPTLRQIHGKKGVPTYGLPGTKKRLRRLSADKFQAESLVGDGFFTLDLNANTLTLVDEKQPFIPRFVFKALSRMGLALCPRAEFPYFRKAIEWLHLEPHEEPAALPFAFGACMSSRVEKRFRAGALSATVFVREVGEGEAKREFASVQLQRAYKGA